MNTSAEINQNYDRGAKILIGAKHSFKNNPPFSWLIFMNSMQSKQ